MIAMLELQRIRFAGWALTEGQHRPKAGKKKKDPRSGSFFSGSRFVLDVPSGSGLTDFSPFVISIYLSIVHPSIPCIQSGSTAPGASPGQVKILTCKVSLAKRLSERLKL